MRKPKVFITRKIPERGLQIIKNKFDAEVWVDYPPPPKKVIIQNVRNVDGLVSTVSDEIDAVVFDAAPNLRIVAQLAVGYDNIDVKEATKRGIYVSNTPGVLTETTADFAWALMMSVARRITEADQYIRSGKWRVGWHPTMLLGRDVYGATLGIIGLGRIGKAVAKRAKGFGMKILYYDIIKNPELEESLGIKYSSLNELLQKSDFISIHIPHTKSTRHLINEEKLKLMKNTAYLINNSRGQIVDEKALYEALKNGQIAGAGLDVFDREPTAKSNPLLELNNVVVAPHISSASQETRSRMSEMVAENLISFFDGKVPPNLVNKDVFSA